jgi:hypothetical protein
MIATFSRNPLATVSALIALTAATAAVAVPGARNAGAAKGANPSGLPQGDEPASLDPAEFTTRIDNRYWPMKPGSRWVYREVDGNDRQRVVVRVTKRTKTIANGVEARVVRDVVTDEKGRPVEITDDWYAQDSEGNVWYLGEDTAEYEHGKVVSTAGSWEAGVGGAQAGVIMPGEPQVGMTYRQEYLKGEAEDRARVLSLDEQAHVPAGHFGSQVLLTKDYTPLEPKVLEYKLYAPGVGPVLVLDVSGASGREELVRFERGK